MNCGMLFVPAWPRAEFNHNVLGRCAVCNQQISPPANPFDQICRQISKLPGLLAHLALRFLNLFNIPLNRLVTVRRLL